MSTRGRRIGWGIAAVVLAVAGCGAVPTVAAGTGDVVSEDRVIADVTGVDLATSGTVDVTTGPPALAVEAPSDVLPVLTSEVSGGVLRLSVQDRTALRDVERIHYRLTVPSLDRIVVSGSGTVNHPDLKGSSLTVQIDGSGDVTVRGTVDEQVVGIRGSGTYSAADLATRTAEITIDGSGDVDVRVSDTLEVDVSGSGDVTYRGSPSVRKEIRGSGGVRQAQ